MKKFLLPVMVLAAAAVSGQASAANGKVEFTGEIVNSTCQVSSDSQNINVYLGKYPTSAFKTVGDKSASKAFQINLEQCEPGTYTVRFDGNTVAGHPDLLAVSSSGATAAAKGVGIEITDVNGKAFPIADQSQGDVPTVTVVSDKKAIFNLQARYRSYVNTVTAGLANATSPFTIEYK
ncbi:pilus assembly protein [Edwardsiella ictaluri]|uniref:Major type 1 fimbrial subunit protein, putative n=3 Tax=Edwardsiella ictaluri TaxID=67780 RepID=C5BD21_EDWI9|nr:fimbrial protein [Edwardsiella ictaluri]ACR68339.1 major type 1 fimbrial subunit protein, putative [Edwardsiella ictaluri 93-146]ARD40681.1 pilus assembly protein [Edwardsiella ictaluri]AVZ81304.1 pilus assembly protein [Edwardsiella ictaluri]EKS7764536.1 fimbrial protein [Edwardsiella ictaluri]EKS7771575.1 fimbrial protein [Edwardsiella ictaluri]